MPRDAKLLALEYFSNAYLRQLCHVRWRSSDFTPLLPALLLWIVTLRKQYGTVSKLRFRNYLFRNF